MTTFEMAQKAYENPGKVFKSQCGIRACFLDGLFMADSAVHDVMTEMDLLDYQVGGYVWEEERTPRKWSGEYERNELGVIAGALSLEGAPFSKIPHGVKTRVKWEAEEVL